MVGSLYDNTACLTAKSHVPFGDSLSIVPCSFWGVSVWESLFGGLCLGGSLYGDPPTNQGTVFILLESFLVIRALSLVTLHHSH